MVISDKKKTPPNIYAIIKGEGVDYGIKTSKATFKELCYLLGAMEIMKSNIVEHMENIKPEYEISSDGDKEE